MFFFFVCGEKTIRKDLPGYEGVTCQCHNCGNMSGRVLKRRPFFTFCWIPLIPFSIKGYQDISCHICGFNQPLDQRSAVQAMKDGGGTGEQRLGAPPGQHQMGPLPGGNGEWQGQHKGGPPPQQGGYGGPQQGGFAPGPQQQRYG